MRLSHAWRAGGDSAGWCSANDAPSERGTHALLHASISLCAQSGDFMWECVDTVAAGAGHDAESGINLIVVSAKNTPARPVEQRSVAQRPFLTSWRATAKQKAVMHTDSDRWSKPLLLFWSTRRFQESRRSCSYEQEIPVSVPTGIDSQAAWAAIAICSSIINLGLPPAVVLASMDIAMDGTVQHAEKIAGTPDFRHAFWPKPLYLAIKSDS